jgi:hypothetical protein
MLTIPTHKNLVSEPEPLVPSTRRELLTQFPNSDDYLLVLDNTALTKFKECPLSAAHYLVYGREAHAKNAALSFGSAIHVGLESILRGEDDATTTAAVLKFFSENPPPPDEYRTPATALEVLRHYHQRATLADYQWQLLTDATGPIIERAFELPLMSIIIDCNLKLPAWDAPRFVARIFVAWSGRIDTVAFTHGMNRVVDHKTSSIDGDQFTQAFHLSSQVLGYIWAGRQLWPDLDLRAFCVNVIRLKKPTGSTGLLDKGPRGGEPALKFFRAYFQYSPERMDWWLSNTRATVSDLVHCLVRSFFPANDTHCIGKYGRCQYHDVCCNDSASMRERMLVSDLFKTVTWNPTANR